MRLRSSSICRITEVRPIASHSPAARASSSRARPRSSAPPWSTSVAASSTAIRTTLMRSPLRAAAVRARAKCPSACSPLPPTRARIPSHISTGPRKADGRRHDVATGERRELRVQLERAVAQAQHRDGLGQRRHRPEPQVVARQRREVVARETVELELRLGGAARVGERGSERGAPDGHRGHPVGVAAHVLADVARAALDPVQHDELRVDRQRDRRVGQLAADRGDVGEQAARLREAPLDRDPPRALQRHERHRPAVARRRGQPLGRLDRHVRAGQVVELEQQVDVAAARVERQRRLARALGQREQRLQPLEPLHGVVGPARRKLRRRQRERERHVVAEAPGHLERLVRELDAARQRVRPVQRGRQRAEQAHAQRVVAGPDALERLDEQRDMGVVDEARRQRERGGAERRARERVVRADRARSHDRLLERLARGRPAGARLGGAQAEQQRGAPRDVGLEQRERFERAREQLDRLLVGEALERALGRALRVVDGLREVPARRRRQEVVRELGQVRVDRAPVDLLERLDRPRRARPSAGRRSCRPAACRRSARDRSGTGRPSPGSPGRGPARRRGPARSARCRDPGATRARATRARTSGPGSRRARASARPARRAARGGGGSSRAPRRAAAGRRAGPRGAPRRAAARGSRARRTRCPRCACGPPARAPVPAGRRSSARSARRRRGARGRRARAGAPRARCSTPRPARRGSGRERARAS